MSGFLILTGLVGLGIGIWLGMPGRYTQTPEDIDRAMEGPSTRRSLKKRQINPLAWLQRNASAKGTPSRGRRRSRSARKGFSIESPEDRDQE
ncbi:MAG: hypothetical protein AAF389_19460 [Gemmatimonadota bacterium]